MLTPAACLKIVGGRFNPIGLPALYTSMTVLGAWAESQQGFALKAQPLTMCTYDVNCSDIADLTDPETKLGFNIKDSDINCNWRISQGKGSSNLPDSQAMAVRLFKLGVAGIIVPSFVITAPLGSKNIVFWKWSKSIPYKVLVIDDASRLPTDQTSWHE